MSAPETRTVEVICTLNDEEFESRRTWARKNVAPHLQSLEKIEAGLKFVYPADATVREQIEEFAALERQCCGGFLDFSFADDTAAQQFHLLVTGPADVQDILENLKARIEQEKVA